MAIFEILFAASMAPLVVLAAVSRSESSPGLLLRCDLSLAGFGAVMIVLVLALGLERIVPTVGCCAACSTGHEAAC